MVSCQFQIEYPVAQGFHRSQTIYLKLKKVSVGLFCRDILTHEEVYIFRSAILSSCAVASLETHTETYPYSWRIRCIIDTYSAPGRWSKEEKAASRNYISNYRFPQEWVCLLFLWTDPQKQFPTQHKLQNFFRTMTQCLAFRNLRIHGMKLIYPSFFLVINCRLPSRSREGAIQRTPWVEEVCILNRRFLTTHYFLCRWLLHSQLI